MMRQRARVYVIACEGSPLLKIGVAGDCEKRLRSLQIGCPYELFLVFQTNTLLAEIAYQVECRVHDVLSDHHRRGEWFETNIETIISAIKGARKYIRNKRGNNPKQPGKFIRLIGVL